MAKRVKKGKGYLGIKAIAGISGLAVIAVIMAAVLNVGSKEGVVCHINGEEIYEEEVLIAAERVELAVTQEFAELTGQEIGDVDFTVEVNGKSGYEYWGGVVREELIRMKVIQIEAKKHGIYDVSAYPEIEKRREEENQERLRSKSEGGVVYGLVSFEKEEYYRYLIDNLNLQNKRYLAQSGELDVTETEAEAEYKKNPAAFDNQEYESVVMFVKNAVISRKYEEYMENMQKDAAIENEENIVRFLKETNERG